MKAPGRKAGARFRAALLSAISVLAILAALEVLLRVLGMGPEVAAELRPVYEKFAPDQELIWSLKKSWSGRELNGARVRTGRLGFRGPEVSPGARPTILFLGDSVVYGHELGDAQTLPARLRVDLAARGLRDVQVVNGGVPGYSTFQEATFYRTKGRSLDPDLVLLGFCLNDVTERYVTVARYGGPRWFMLNVDTAEGVGAFGRLWLSSAIRSAVTGSARALGKRSEVYRVESLWRRPQTPAIQEAWDVVFQELDALIAAVREDGVRFAAVLFPYRLQLNDPHTLSPQRVLADFFAAREIAFLDLLAPMEAEGRPARLFMDANHLSPAGAARVAGWISDFVLERGLLPADPGTTR